MDELKDNLRSRLFSLKPVKDDFGDIDLSATIENIREILQNFIQEKIEINGKFLFMPEDLDLILFSIFTSLLNTNLGVWGNKKVSVVEFLNNLNMADESLVEKNQDMLDKLNEFVTTELPKYLPAEIINDLWETNLDENDPLYQEQFPENPIKVKYTDKNGNEIEKVIWVLNRSWSDQFDLQFKPTTV